MEYHPGQGPKRAVIEDYLGELLKHILSTSGWYLLCTMVHVARSVADGNIRNSSTTIVKKTKQENTLW